MKKLSLEQHEFDVIREIMAELIDTETLAKYTEEMINSEVIRRFWDYTN